MNFILCGEDPLVLPLVRAIASDPQHRLSYVVAGGTLADEAARLQPGVRQVESWAEVTAVNELDAAIIAGAEESVLEAARQLAAAGRPLLVFPHAGQGAVFAYQLTLLRDDALVLLCPMMPLGLHPLAGALREAAAEGRLGPLLHLELAREHAPEVADRSLLSQAQIDAALLTDVELLRGLAGEYSQVTALHSGQTAAGTALASVALAGPNLPEATWSLRPAGGRTGPDDAIDRWTLTVTGERGHAVLQSANGRMTLTLPEESEPRSLAAYDLGPELLAQFVDAHAGMPVRPDWTDLTRSFEIVDAARRSIRRRRTIDLHFETTSERSLFKTQMTAIGCGLLSLTFLAVLGLLMAGALFDTRDAREMKSDAAGFIIRWNEFAPRTDELTADGAAHLADVATRMPAISAVVLVEQPAEQATPLDERRRNAVVERLEALGRADADARTALARLHGEAFRGAMRVLRLLVFLPLFVFLVLQVLLLIARPSAFRTPLSNRKAAPPEKGTL